MKSTASRIIALASLAGLTQAQNHNYRVEVLATFETTTVITAASEAGHAVGWQVSDGQVRAFVASQGQGLTLLPLAPGHQTSAALDVNSSGMVVGTSSTGTFPFDGGVPAIWTIANPGTYTPVIPQQFTSLPSPLGTLSVNGGQIVGLNESGTMIGWSRYQGFQGGPTTKFFMDAPPVNVQELGFQATVRDVNNNDVIVGDGKRYDLTTNTLTELGLPDPVSTVHFNSVIGYAINDSNTVVAAARRATSGNEIYLTYLHDDAEGWRPLDPTDLAARFVGFYDINNLGEVSATGGILFAQENILVQSMSSLLRPEDAHWQVDLGFIDNQRRFVCTAIETNSGQNAIVMLVPMSDECIADTNGDGFLTPADFTAWLAAFNTQSSACDQNGDALCSPADFTAWVANFNAGC